VSNPEPSLDEQVRIFVQGTSDQHAFISQRIVPLLQGHIGPTKYEQALILTYYRIALFLESLSLLKDPKHFQAANGICRSLFELLLDMELLCKDAALADQFFDFAFVVRFHAAQKATSISGVDLADIPAQSRFVSDPANRIKAESLCERHWGRDRRNSQLRWPEHWIGKKIFDRARECGRELYYRTEYFQQCQNVHAGGAGTAGIDAENLARSFVLSHAHSQKHVAEASQMICEQLNLFRADSSLQLNLRRASASAALHLYPGMIS
jgi:hypothetical protein